MTTYNPADFAGPTLDVVFTLTGANASWETTILGGTVSNRDPLGTEYVITDFPVTVPGLLDAVDQHRPSDDWSLALDPHLGLTLFYDDGGAGPDFDYNDLVGVAVPYDAPAPVPLPAPIGMLAASLLCAAYLAKRCQRV